MQRSATLTGPGISRSPAIQRRTVRASTSSASAAATCDKPSAAMAARNSSADNDATFQHAETLRRDQRADGFERVIGAERRGQRAIGAEQRQALRTILAAADETNGFGGKGGDVNGLAHTHLVGPAALAVKQEMTPAASEFWRRVVSGERRLTKNEDAGIWAARAAGMSFAEIAQTIMAVDERRRLSRRQRRRA